MPTGPVAYWNGRLLPYSQAALAPHDAGFVWGAVVTDLTRTFRGEPFRLAQHAARFRQSCELVGVTLGETDDALTDAARDVTTANMRLVPGGGELVVVFVATPGELGGRGGPDADGPPTVGVHTFPLQFQRYRRYFTNGAKLARHDAVMPADLIDPRIKHRSRLHWWLSERGPGKPAGVDYLYCDAAAARPMVTETAAANFLMVERGAVASPAAGTVLEGTSLAVVRELCQQLGVPFEERPIAWDEALRCGEAVLCNATFCLAGVSQIGDEQLPWPGPLTRRLLAAYSELVGVDVAGQFLEG